MRPPIEKVVVTPHALQRYKQRVYCGPTDEDTLENLSFRYRQSFEDPDVVDHDREGNRYYHYRTMHHRMWFVVDANDVMRTVLTVLPRSKEDLKKRRNLRRLKRQRA